MSLIKKKKGNCCNVLSNSYVCESFQFNCDNKDIWSTNILTLQYYSITHRNYRWFQRLVTGIKITCNRSDVVVYNKSSVLWDWNIDHSETDIITINVFSCGLQRSSQPPDWFYFKTVRLKDPSSLKSPFITNSVLLFIVLFHHKNMMR